MTKQKGIPYNIIGGGIMVADAKDVRRVAKEQFDKCNEWSNNRGKTKMNSDKQYAIDVLQQAIKICEDYSIDRYSLYKGRPPYKGNEDGRADDYVQGQSDGADYCMIKLEELLAHYMDEQ